MTGTLEVVVPAGIRQVETFPRAQSHDHCQADRTTVISLAYQTSYQHSKVRTQQ